MFFSIFNCTLNSQSVFRCVDAVGVFALRPLRRAPLPARALLQDTYSKVWTGFFLPLPLLWPLFCGDKVRVWLNDGCWGTDLSRACRRNTLIRQHLMFLFSFAVQRCSDWTWNKGASSTRFRLMLCKYNRVFSLAVDGFYVQWYLYDPIIVSGEL